MNNYRLVDGLPVPEPDVLAWARWFGSSDRIVAQTSVPCDGGPDLLVSTIFLGTDHSFGDGGPPVLWETMVFGLPGDDPPQWRYRSSEDALEGHERACRFARNGGAE